MKITMIKKPAILLLSLIALQNCASKVNKNSSPIVSSYKGGEVTLKDVDNELSKLAAKNSKVKDLTFDKLKFEQKEAIIKEVVLKEIAYQEAKKRDLDKDQDYQEVLKAFESEILKQKLLVTLAKDASDEKNVKKNYDEIVSKLKDKKDYKISYIAVKTEKEAQGIYQYLLKSPNSFASQARRKSIDKETAKKGGDLGFVLEDALPVEIVKQVKTLNKGQIAAPISASRNWIIVKFEDSRPAEILPFEKAKEMLAQNLAKKAVNDFVSQSLEKAQINILVK
jgi:parvulin-like peptidyl-prolyl isomerase